MNRRKMLIAMTLVAIAIGMLFWHTEDSLRYYRHDGHVFGTIYNIQYEGSEDLSDSIAVCLQQVDQALSMFNPHSTLSRINNNDSVIPTPDIVTVFTEAQSVSLLSDGAFDMTVAPLVNAWGFGFEHQADMTAERVDSLRQLVGYGRIRIQNGTIVKDDAAIRMDAGAIAKGYGCDCVAAMLQRNGCQNLLVDIGGEVVARGTNSQGKPWRIGITKPIDDIGGTVEELQDVIETESICMATSGNYRNFYYDGAVRRSHTIDPRTGYPVQHSLLSATVTASSCMRADALATACMVLGADDALQMIERTTDAACYLIVAQGDSMRIVCSKRWMSQQQ